MDSSPVANPTRAPIHACKAWPLPFAGLILLCLGSLMAPNGVLARTPLVKPCSHTSSGRVYAPRGFGGYACRDDRCSSHKAGFDWAERNGIADAGACASPHDPAFVEGCRAFAEEAVTAEQAGFEWARENEIEDTCDCAGAGPGFDAGCAAYINGFAQ